MADTAEPSKEYSHVDRILDFGATEDQKTFLVQILGQEELSEERVFRVELYDPNKPEGSDTLTGSGAQCKVILSDQEAIGSVGFAKSEIRVSQAQEAVEIQLERIGDCQGEVMCTLSTEQFEVHTKQQQSAQEWVDYVP